MVEFICTSTISNIISKISKHEMSRMEFLCGKTMEFWGEKMVVVNYLFDGGIQI